ncbi:hypothetical protein [Halorussus salinisoli]|uniref:hypothetical protein n=1 Tax=Halorussus salinisoli TaxID=2558242 RepID=UPI0010C21BC7|nr:hypothetical protein [Halorussus salinisoli]
MFRTLHSRTLAIFGLLALLFGLAVWYGSLGPAPALGDYPDQEHLATDYNYYLDSQVTVSGRIVTTDPVTIVAEYGADDTIQLTIVDLAVSPSVGDKLRVYGIVKPDQSIRAINAFTVPQRGLGYTWTVSFLAGLWVLARLIRYWQFDPTDWTLTTRHTPILSHYLTRIRTHIPYIRD